MLARKYIDPGPFKYIEPGPFNPLIREGLILVRQLAAKWLKVRLDARVLNKIDPGPFYFLLSILAGRRQTRYAIELDAQRYRARCLSTFRQQSCQDGVGRTVTKILATYSEQLHLLNDSLVHAH
jgi:hypothetical protein